MKINLFGRILSIEFKKANTAWYTRVELCSITGMRKSACYMWCKRKGFKRKKIDTASYEYFVSDYEINKKMNSINNKLNRKPIAD
jgi:hypothetical protein